jgi:AmmeMemoRadiSam system protein A
MTPEFGDAQRRLLLRIARDSIASGLGGGGPIGVPLEDLPQPLRAMRATFVTIYLGEALRGCIGSLEPHRAVAEDVAHNAFASAFHDPRFSPLTEIEMTSVRVQVAVLQPSLPITFRTEDELLSQLRVGQDGLILQYGSRRATFLPSVWETLPEPRGFLAALKRKAGMRPEQGIEGCQFSRYATEAFADVDFPEP